MKTVLLTTWILALAGVFTGILIVAFRPSPEPPEAPTESSSDSATFPGPTPTLSPQQVVQIQLDALRRNDEPEPDTGIAISFRFASPANRRDTGPLERFIQLVKSPNYSPMLYHKMSEFGPLDVEDDRARITVRLITTENRVAAYLFVLSKQTHERYIGCWMTDAVIRIPPPSQRQPDSESGGGDKGDQIPI